MKIVSSDEMRLIEEECARLGITTGQLMENAGHAVADISKQLLDEMGGGSVLVLAGPGNNGGDGLVAARHLAACGFKVKVISASDPKDLPDSVESVTLASDGSLDWVKRQLGSVDLVIDALFGTGSNRPIESICAEMLGAVVEAKKNRPEIKILAVDLPSGLSADTGQADPATLKCDFTVTLGLPKRGLYTAGGAGHAGQVVVADIGIPEAATDFVKTELLTEEWVRERLPVRSPVANKGSFGRVMVIAGSINYIGAAYLACSGALRVGAGLVTLATPASLVPILAAKLTESTFLPLPEIELGYIAGRAATNIASALTDYDVLLVGCGLGRSPQVGILISEITSHLAQGLSLVLDADALNALGGIPDWWQRLEGDAILTPHPGEMGRLCGVSVERVQSERFRFARESAQRWQKMVVLKGAYTVIAAPDGRMLVNPFANAGLASAGTGDVLAGVIAGMLGQGLGLFEAAGCGVWLHARAGEAVRERLGDAGMLASDLLPELPLALKRLKEA